MIHEKLYVLSGECRAAYAHPLWHSSINFNYIGMNRLSLFIILILLLNKCTGIIDNNPGSNIHNYSDFSQFTFEQSPALGFCPNFESLYKAEIKKTDDSAYIFYSSEFQFANRDTFFGECIKYISSDTICLIEKSLPERELNSFEIELIKSIFSHIETIPNRPDECSHMGIDPCRIIACGWDTKRHTDYYCSSNRLTSIQVKLILNLLDDLRIKN